MIFGGVSESFSSFGKAIVANLYMLLGIYEPQDDMEVTSQPRLANFYYWSYTMIAFFILLNALLAIVVDAYAACKSEADSQAEIVGAPYPYVRLASVHADFDGTCLRPELMSLCASLVVRACVAGSLGKLRHEVLHQVQSA